MDKINQPSYGSKRQKIHGYGSFFFFFFNVLHAICSIKINKCYSQDCLLCIAPTATGGHFTETNHHLQLQTKKIFILIKR